MFGLWCHEQVKARSKKMTVTMEWSIPSLMLRTFPPTSRGLGGGGGGLPRAFWGVWKWRLRCMGGG